MSDFCRRTGQGRLPRGYLRRATYDVPVTLDFKIYSSDADLPDAVKRIEVGVLQINRFTCERCGLVEETEYESAMYSDPIIHPPRPGWGYYTTLNDEFVCPECRENLKTRG